jgi:hypothetical protein
MMRVGYDMRSSVVAMNVLNRFPDPRRWSSESWLVAIITIDVTVDFLITYSTGSHPFTIHYEIYRRPEIPTDGGH